MSWRLARSLGTLGDEIDAAWPDRDRASDGTIGDAAHRQRCSRHNPNDDGVVCARDFTHDPPYFDAHALADRIVARQRNPDTRHPELEYVLSAGRYANAQTGWQWRKRSQDDHHGHIHVAVGEGSDCEPEPPYDSTRPWLTTTPAPPSRRKP